MWPICRASPPLIDAAALPFSFPALDDAAAAAASAAAAAAAVNLPSPLRNPLAFRIVSISLVLKQSFPATADGAAVRPHLFDLMKMNLGGSTSSSLC